MSEKTQQKPKLNGNLLSAIRGAGLILSFIGVQFGYNTYIAPTPSQTAPAQQQAVDTQEEINKALELPNYKIDQALAATQELQKAISEIQARDERLASMIDQIEKRITKGGL